MNWSCNTPNTVIARMILASIAVITKLCLVCFASYNRNKFRLMWVLLMCCRFWCVIYANACFRIRRRITVVWNSLELGQLSQFKLCNAFVKWIEGPCVWVVDILHIFSKLWICKNVPADCGKKRIMLKKQLFAVYDKTYKKLNLMATNYWSSSPGS